MEAIRSRRYLLPVVALLAFVFSRQAFADEEALARQAEEAGNLRQALTHYVAALQSTSEGSTNEFQLSEKIIKLAIRIKPPPAKPEEVIRYEGRAEAAVRNAKTPEDFLDAAREYRKALRLAPWVASYYFNLGVVLEKAGKQNDAIQNFKLYLLAEPSAEDAREVQKRIAGLDYEMEKVAAAKEAEARRLQADQTLAAQLVGVWQNPRIDYKDWKGNFCTDQVRGYRVRITAVGTKVSGTVIGTPMVHYKTPCKSWYTPTSVPYFEAKVEGGRLIGTKNDVWYSSDGAGIAQTNSYDVDIRMGSGGYSYKEIPRDKAPTWSEEWMKE